MLYSEKARARMWVAQTQPVLFAPRPVPLAPYLVGAVLGGGWLTGTDITFFGTDRWVLDRVACALPAGHEVVPAGGCSYRLPARGNATAAQKGATLGAKLRALGLQGLRSEARFIPDLYRYNTAPVRWEVLRGLMDTGGSVDRNGQPIFEVVSEALAHGLAEIAESLGASCGIQVQARIGCQPVYRVAISHEDAPRFFSLPRKREKARRKRRSVHRSFRAITHVGSAPAQCIKLDDPRGLYLTDRFIVTHNTMSHLEYLLDRGIVAGEGNWWWVATVSGTARIAFDRAKDRLRGFIQKPSEDGETFSRVRVADPIPFTSRTSPAMEILCQGATFAFKSAEKPDNLYGDDVRGLVGDEVTRWREAAYHACYSVVTATKGWMRFIGNVKGRRNWAYKIARRAQGGAQGWGYHKLTAFHAAAGGIMDPAIIAQAERDLPPHVYRELYLAEAAEDTSNPCGFDAIRACTMEALSHARPAAWGWDLAKSIDWTVGIGLDPRGDTARFERWNKHRLPAGVTPGLDYWEITEKRIRELTGSTAALVDSTGVGDPILERIAKGRPNIEGMVFTSSPASKQRLMEGLAAAIQQRRVRFPEGLITSELESFEYTYTRNGVRYSAPDGLHDDCVCALALAVQRLGARPEPLTESNFGAPEIVEDGWASIPV